MVKSSLPFSDKNRYKYAVAEIEYTLHLSRKNSYKLVLTYKNEISKSYFPSFKLLQSASSKMDDTSRIFSRCAIL